MIHICDALLDVAHAATRGSPAATDARPDDSKVEKSPSSKPSRFAAGARRWLGGSSYKLVRARAFGLWAW